MYFILVFSSKNIKTDKNIYIGQKLTEQVVLNNSVSKVIAVEEEYKEISKKPSIDRATYIANLKNRLQEVNEKDLNSFYKHKFLTIKRKIEKEEYIGQYINRLNKALVKLQFNKAYKIAKILYRQTKDSSYFSKIKDKKLYAYNRIADKYFVNKNYEASKNFYSLCFTLNQSEQIKERLQTIDNIFKLSGEPVIPKKKVVLTNLSDRIADLEKQYRFLHAYYLIKRHMFMVDGRQREDLYTAVNSIAKKWKEVRKISANFLKDAFTLSKSDKRLELEQALKKVELARKYFPYFYKYDKIITELKNKIEFSGMTLIPEGVVTYIHPITKKKVTTNVASFYIDKEYLTFGEYLHYLAEKRKDKFEELKKLLITHKFRGDITQKVVELVSFYDVKKFAKYVGKKLPTIEQIVRFCDLYRTKAQQSTADRNLHVFPKQYSVFSSYTIGNRVIAVNNNYMTKKPDIDCSVFFEIPNKNRGFLGLSVKLVKPVKTK